MMPRMQIKVPMQRMGTRKPETQDAGAWNHRPKGRNLQEPSIQDLSVERQPARSLDGAQRNPGHTALLVLVPMRRMETAAWAASQL